MAFAAIAGLASAVGGAAIGAAAAGGFFAALTGSGLMYFAVGAGLSMVSRALMPKPSIGQQMVGLDFTVREPDATRKMIYGRTRVGGAIAFIDTTDGDDDKNEYIHMVIAIAGHEIDAFEKIYFNNELVWNSGTIITAWNPFIDVNVHLGDQTTADSDLVARSAKWTSSHILRDTAYMYVRLKYDAEQFANGLPNISATVRGKKVLNPVTSVTEWTQNPALCVYDYLRDTKYGLSESALDINSTALATAISLCDQDVALAAGGNQARYTLDGVIDTANSKKENIEAMLSAMSGKLVYSSGEYFVSGGAYVAPTVTIDESVMIGGLEVQTKQSRRSLYNGVKGIFRSEEDDYNAADYPAQLSSTYSAADGDPIYLDMALPFTTNNIRAQRIAKLALLQSRQQTTITVPCNLTALKFRAGDTVMITNAKMGWDQKVFQVLGYDLSLNSSGEIVVNIQAIETAAAIYDWTSSDEEDYLAGGELELYDGKTAQPPIAPLGLAASSTVNADGTVTPTINVSWTAAADAFTDYYLVQWYNSTAGGTAVNQSTKTTAFTIGPVEPASNYVVTVYAYNGLGVRSTAITGNVATITDTTPKLPSIYQINTDSTVEPTTAQFSAAAGRGPKEGDIVIGKDTTVTPNKTYAWSYNLSSTDWTANANFISGDLIVDGSITATELAVDSVTADKISVTDLAAINANLGSITAGSIDGVTVKIGSGSSVFKADTNGIYLGDETFANADFRVTPAGAITATSATITGTININNVDGSTVTYSGGNLQVGSIGTGNINNDAVTNALIATDAVNQDSIAANSVTASEIVAGTITATEIAANTITAAEIAANTITATQIAANTITAAEIQATSITVDKLSGDVTELYPFALEVDGAITRTVTTTYQQFYIPAPELAISKRNRLNVDVELLLQNTTATDYEVRIQLGVQVLAKSVPNVSLGTVTHVSYPKSYRQLVYVSGNVIDKCSNSGGLSNNTTGSSPYYIASPASIWYDAPNDRTYINLANFWTLSSGDTLYFNQYRFSSAGTWLSANWPRDLSYYCAANTSKYATFSISESLGQSTTATGIRISSYGSFETDNVDCTLLSVNGTMENVS